MTKPAKFLAVSAAVCLVVWGLLMLFGVQLMSSDGNARVDVVYGEGEDFFSDALAFRKRRNDAFLLVQLPHARPAYRWVAVDYENQAITFAKPPRKLGSLTYWLKSDEQGVRIGDQGPSDDWQWHFTEEGAAFSGNGFSCRVKKRPRGNTHKEGI